MKQLPDRLYIEMLYQIRTGKKIDLSNPKTFNEKLNWMKLYDRDPKYTKLADKYVVKKVVSDKIGDEFIIPLIGCWDNVDEIKLSDLPEKFVLKCNHDSGSVVICKDKSSFDFEAARNKLKKALKNNYFYYSREWVYKDIPPKVICEPYVEDIEDAELRDYKFFCFDGKVEFLYVATDRFKEGEEVKFTFFDRDYNFIPVRHAHNYADPLPKKPDRYDEMVEIAEKLSDGLKCVRVDLYEANGKIYFSEYTFYNNSGFTPFEPDEWDYIFGEKLKVDYKMKQENGTVAEWKRSKLSLIISVLSIMSSIIVAVISIKQAEEIREIKGTVIEENLGNVATVYNDYNGLTLEDTEYLTQERINEILKRMYQFDEVLSMVESDTNLHFALIWSGTKDEYEKVDYKDKLPYVYYRVYDEKTNTYSIIDP